MYWDYHMHCNFSGDSDAKPKEMVLGALRCGLKEICFTDHLDLVYPNAQIDFALNPPEYLAYQQKLADEFADVLTIRKGVEIGMQPHIGPTMNAAIEGCAFDFIIASVHIVKGVDCYFPAYYAGRDLLELYEEYLYEVLAGIKALDRYSIAGHICYPQRWADREPRYMLYKDMPQAADTLLRHLIQSGHGIEINTSSFVTHGGPTPGYDFVKRYKQLGGEIITIGSDAHKPQDIARSFGPAVEGLKEAGFDYITTFEQMQPTFVKLP